MKKKQKKLLWRIALSALLTAAACLAPLSGVWRMIAFLVPYGVVGYDVLRRAVRGIVRLRPFDENFLMAIATVGAFALGEYLEAVAVMLLYQIGELFQSIAVGKSRRSIGALMDIRPDTAALLREDGTVETVAPDEVGVGSLILVLPGEKVPLDGTVEDGESALDTSALTGESRPRTVRPGDEVPSGTVNVSSPLRIRTTRPFGASTASKILALVENAGAKKSRSEQFITRFARVYTPAVVIAALALAVLPPLVSLLFGEEADFAAWVYRAFSFLVISCPCALVISIPLSFFAAIGGASRAGILVKGSNYLETLSRVRTVVFDKTGTVTEGVFAVADICPAAVPSEELLELAAHAELFSTHPISRGLREAYHGELNPGRVENVRENSGQGVTASVDGHLVAVGNEKLMTSLGVRVPPCAAVGTVVRVAVDGQYAGHILIADRVKPNAGAAVAALRAAGVRRTVMLTGDRREVGEAVAAAIGIDEALCGLLPDGKVAALETMLDGGKNAVAFVGDGINDAPVLTRADVGIAMGALGSDAAIEAADIVLMDDDPRKVAVAIRHAGRCLRIVRENIVFALAVKTVCLILATVGAAGMWLAVFADVGVMVIAVWNAIRALRVEKGDRNV